MEIVLEKEDGTEFARFADAEELARKFVDVCVTADDEITKLRNALKIAHENLEDTAHLVETGVEKEKILRSLEIKIRHAAKAINNGEWCAAKCPHDWQDDGDNLQTVCKLCGLRHDVDLSWRPGEVEELIDSAMREE